MSPSPPGVFTISLDFELYWGVHDHTDRDAFRQRAAGARQVVPELLQRLADHRMHATFATVGFLFAKDQADLDSFSPNDRPIYDAAELCAYRHLANTTATEDEATAPDLFAPSLIAQIASAEGQELASHTFSHCYALEPGMTEQHLEADLRAALQIASRDGHRLRSLAFPRNQYDDRYLRAAARAGFDVVRGNASGFLYAPMPQDQLTWWIRAIRLADDYLPISGNNCAPLPAATSDRSLPLVVPASRFLRPWSRSRSLLENVRFRRIANSMTRAAKRAELYHLWFHPHNFSTNTGRNFDMLERILVHFDYLRDRYAMRTLTMAELSSTDWLTDSKHASASDAPANSTQAS